MLSSLTHCLERKWLSRLLSPGYLVSGEDCCELPELQRRKLPENISVGKPPLMPHPLLCAQIYTRVPLVFPGDAAGAWSLPSCVA